MVVACACLPPGSPRIANPFTFEAVDAPAYQSILPLRTATVTGEVAILDGVPEGYKAASLVAKGD